MPQQTPQEHVDEHGALELTDADVVHTDDEIDQEAKA